MCFGCEHGLPHCLANPKGARPPCLKPQGHDAEGNTETERLHKNVYGDVFGEDEVCRSAETLDQYTLRRAGEGRFLNIAHAQAYIAPIKAPMVIIEAGSVSAKATIEVVEEAAALDELKGDITGFAGKISRQGSREVLVVSKTGEYAVRYIFPNDLPDELFAGPAWLPTRR